MSQHVTMPREVQEYFNVINQYQPDAFIELFTANASIRDNGKEIQGKEDIQAWGESEIFSAKVRFVIKEVEEVDGNIAVITEMEGEFNRNRVPTPLLMKHEFKVSSGKISGLIIKQQ